MNGFKIAAFALMAMCLLVIILGIGLLFMTEVSLFKRVIVGFLCIFTGIAFAGLTWEMEKDW